MTTQPDYQLPDFELRDLVLKTLKAHPRPIFPAEEGVRIACKCGWKITEKKARSNLGSFQRHQSFEIEYAITALLNEQEEAA